MSAQLQLELAPREPNPNADFFNVDGTPKRLLWCSDSARMGGECPYVGDRLRFRPADGCCKQLAVASRAREPEAVLSARETGS